MSAVESILPVEMHGVMKVSGRRGVGKSFLAATADAPQNIVWFDYENKGEGISNMLGFGLYRAITQEVAGKGAAEVWKLSQRAFSSIDKDRFTVAVLDNISPLEMGMKAEIMNDPRGFAKAYGLQEGNIRSGRFGGSSAVVNMMISTAITDILHDRGVQLVIAVSHESHQWANSGPIPGKYHEKGADRWQELSILSLILTPGDEPPIPSAIVRKEQLGIIEWNAEKREHVVRRRFPERMPKATFAEIRRYLREGDYDSLGESEKTRQDEVGRYNEDLSGEQLAFVTEMARLETAQLVADTPKAVSMGSKPKVTKQQEAIEMAQSNTAMTASEIAAALCVAPILVARWLEE